MKTDATEDLPTGAFRLKDWEDTVELMKKYMALETTMKAHGFLHQRVPAEVVRPAVECKPHPARRRGAGTAAGRPKEAYELAG